MAAAGLGACAPAAPVEKTRELYRAPRVCGEGFGLIPGLTLEWPRYCDGEFRSRHRVFGEYAGESMLELSDAEQRALQVLTLRVKAQKEVYGGPHHFNWKKVGLSVARYRPELVEEGNMPTERCKAAYRFLRRWNPFYDAQCKEQQRRLEAGESLYMSSYDLFIVQRGIECAIFPHLYPTGAFTDTGQLQQYQEETGDSSNRVFSTGLSWTRKVLSSVRAYGEARDLTFLLYERHLGQMFFSAHVRGQRYGVTADVMNRHSQASTGYWEIVQDALADLVRIMAGRCFDEKNYPRLYQQCRGLRQKAQ